MKERPEFKVIIMSATIDANVFEDYFKREDIRTRVIYAPGKQSHVVTHVYETSHHHAKYMEVGLQHLKTIIEDPSSDPAACVWLVATSNDAVQAMPHAA
jgi:HrpA-like RNA helicase